MNFTRYSTTLTDRQISVYDKARTHALIWKSLLIFINTCIWCILLLLLLLALQQKPLLLKLVRWRDADAE